MSLVPAVLPKPDDVPLPALLTQCQQLWRRRRALEIRLDQVDEVMARARLVEAYLRRREGYADAVRAARALEAAVGDALGKAEEGRPKKTSRMRAVSALPRMARHRCRLLAAHRAAWEPECERQALSQRQALQLVQAAIPPVASAPAELILTAQVPTRETERYYSIEQWKRLSSGERADIIAAGFESKTKSMNAQTGDSIEWARWSHNTVTGCLHDCPYCYARDIAERLYPQKFAPSFHPARLAGPGLVSIPTDKATADPSYRNIFANSMSDLFGQWVPEDWITATIEMARRNPQWNFLILTKFPQRAAEFTFPDNWWMGTTVDAQARVANAEKAFEKIQCKTKWLSVEPLLEPLRFTRLDLFQWIVIGGASPSRKTPAWIPRPHLWAPLHAAALVAGLRIYHKTNMFQSEAQRVREFPWIDRKEPVLPKSFRYLKGLA